MPRPLFVVTAPRSGSTFLVAILNSHPRIEMTNEAAWITLLRKTALLAATPSLETIDDGEGFTTVGILPQRYVEDSRAAFAAIVRPFVAGFYARVTDREHDYFGDKILSHNDLAFAIDHFPDARFVELVRDPRDVLVSSYAFEQKQPTAWQDAPFDQRCRHLDTFFGATAALLEGRDRVLVRYEDLVADGPREVAALLRALGLAMTPEVEAYLAGAAAELFAAQGTAATPRASVGRWRTELTEDQKARAAEVLGHHLRRLGFAPGPGA